MSNNELLRAGGVKRIPCTNCSGSGVVIQREHDESEDSVVRACSWCERFSSDSAAIDHVLEMLEREGTARRQLG